MPGRKANSTFVAKGMLSHEWAACRMNMIERIVKKKRIKTGWNQECTACRKK